MGILTTVSPVGCEILFNASKRAKIGIRTPQVWRVADHAANVTVHQRRVAETAQRVDWSIAIPLSPCEGNLLAQSGFVGVDRRQVQALLAATRRDSAFGGAVHIEVHVAVGRGTALAALFGEECGSWTMRHLATVDLDGPVRSKRLARHRPRSRRRVTQQ